MRKPDFENLEKVLSCETPDRPTLFEFFLNPELDRIITGRRNAVQESLSEINLAVEAFAAAGYDYATFCLPGFRFNRGVRKSAQTVSLNDGAVILNRKDFDSFTWPDAGKIDFSIVRKVELKPGMKLIAYTPDGLLENVIGLMGYDNLCVSLYDDPELVGKIFDNVGKALLAYYDRILDFDIFGAAICNDDWGFNSMPLISPEFMRKYVVPWSAEFVRLIHSKGKKAIQHSCGNIYDCGLFEDVVNVCRFDAHHSFEDKILPVEDAYERYCGRICLLGGIDMDFLCRSTPEQIKERSLRMLERAKSRGGYALGSGNSIPEYVPPQNYFAMTSAALQG